MQGYLYRRESDYQPMTGAGRDIPVASLLRLMRLVTVKYAHATRPDGDVK